MCCSIGMHCGRSAPACGAFPSVCGARDCVGGGGEAAAPFPSSPRRCCRYRSLRDEAARGRLASRAPRQTALAETRRSVRVGVGMEQTGCGVGGAREWVERLLTGQRTWSAAGRSAWTTTAGRSEIQQEAPRFSSAKRMQVYMQDYSSTVYMLLHLLYLCKFILEH